MEGLSRLVDLVLERVWVHRQREDGAAVNSIGSGWVLVVVIVIVIVIVAHGVMCTC